MHIPENVNWAAVWQSVTDTWLPLVGSLAAIAVIAVVLAVVRRWRRKKR